MAVLIDLTYFLFIFINFYLLFLFDLLKIFS